ncbi:MAG: hypothetical protein WAP04_00795, partial [Bacillota bacterium]
GATDGTAAPWYNIDVSTHAPARGATYVPEMVTVEQLVSTHAPARGATVERKVAVLRAVKHQISRTSLEREAAEPCYKTKACKSPVKAVLRIPLENQDHLRFAVRNQVINTPSGS